MKNYTMKNTMNVAKLASQDVETYLKNLPYTLEVINVEDSKEYQLKDIDLIWELKDENGISRVTIEIKGDRYYETGNYFLETISNDQKGTPGCFMYTEADYIYYYFVKEKELHILPMPDTREWFIDNMNNFKEKSTSTYINNKFAYNTIGRLVNRNRLQKEVKGAEIIRF